ncbi:MAG TPA: nuclear transport factor 2 family protein [Solirubrobacteraceae bacterium]|nr:nuclear transport factor 2 family protein [Solirubrobacteraceae bacterium]
MYHAIVRRRTTEMFGRLSRGDWETVVGGLAEDVHHVFPGDHPLGGERRTRAAVALWFARLARLFPGHRFEVRRVASRGWPWSTWVAVQWTAELRPQVGEAYVNEGAHWIHLRWGKATSFHAYLDTQRVAAACRAMAESGVEEAAAPPIGD